MRLRSVAIKAVVIGLGIAAVGSQALAATPEGDPAGGKFPVAGTGTSGVSKMSTASGTEISCTSGTGTGQATSKTTGEGVYTLSGCKDVSTNTSCTSAGQPAGTIKTENTIGHFVYLDANHTKIGALATPPASGLFTKFTCFFGAITVEVKGNGVIGEITSPKCGATSKSATVVAEATAPGTQRYRQVEETGTMYDMVVSLNGGALQTAATTWTLNGTSAEQATLTCPEQK